MGTPPSHKSKIWFSNLSPGSRERWIWGIHKEAGLSGFIESFWDGLGAQFCPPHFFQQNILKTDS